MSQIARAAPSESQPSAKQRGRMSEVGDSGGLYASTGNSARKSLGANLYASAGALAVPNRHSMHHELATLRSRRQLESNVLSDMERDTVVADERLADVRSEIRQEAAKLARDRVRRRQLMAVIDSIVSEAEVQRSRLLHFEQEDHLHGGGGDLSAWRFTPVAQLNGLCVHACVSL